MFVCLKKAGEGIHTIIDGLAVVLGGEAFDWDGAVAGRADWVVNMSSLPLVAGGVLLWGIFLGGALLAGELFW